MKRSSLLGLLSAAGVLLALCVCCHGANNPTTYWVTAEWDASPSTNITNYVVYVATNSFATSPTNSVHFDAGTNLTVRCTNLTVGVLYYFVATAQNSIGLESDYSNEVTYQVTKPNPPHMKVNIKFQASTTATGPWEDLADLGDFDTQDGLPFYRAFLSIR